MCRSCDICGDHILDCMCNYEKCQKCNAVIYRKDKKCMKCLIHSAKMLLKQSRELLEMIENED
jgi:hypothetical protein